MSHRGMKRNRRGGRSDGPHRDNPTSSNAAPVDENSPIVKQFRVYQEQLDSRHDKYERVVKMSRDITIESKRAIFLLHRIDRKSPKRNDLLAEVDKKLEEVQLTKWKVLAEELHDEDPYRFLRAYSPGLQEYIEALSLLHYVKDNVLITLAQVEAILCFPRLQPNPATDIDTATTGQQEMDQLPEVTSEVSAMAVDSDAPPPVGGEQISIHIPPTEYILGLADLTGELMRMAIHSVGTGDLDYTFQLCTTLRTIHDAFVTFGNVSRELPRKLTTLRQSLKKVESACYALQIRGSEIPKHMLLDALSSVNMEDYEDHSVDTG